MNTFMNRVGQPAQGVGPVPQQTAGGSKKRKFNFNLTKALYLVVLLGIAVIVVAVIVYMFTFKSGNPSISTAVKSNQYQAVFLNSSDGQVYFGKLTTFNNAFYKLTDIYYVRVQTVQPDKNSTQTQQNISLAKLGNEIHGPEDVMYINKGNVMFFENLKEDGQVVKAIRDYQKNGNKSTTQQNSTTNTTTKTNP
jgi:hypothetical protein